MKLEARNILVRSPNWVGDAVMTTPVLRCLRHNYPDARISVLAKPYVREIYDGVPWIDEIIEYDDAGTHHGLGGLWRLGRELRAGRFDLAVVLPNSLSSALIARLSGARRRLGYRRQRRGWLLTDTLEPPMRDGVIVPRNMVDYYFELLASIGCERTDKMVALFESPEGERRAEELLAEQGRDPAKRLIGINPGASFGSSKMWMPERFANVGDGLIERYGCQVIVFTPEHEREIGEAVIGAMRHPAITTIGHGLSLELLKSLMKRCSLLVTNDTGARHFGVAYGLPVVVIMGSTQSAYTDVNLEKTIIVRVDVDCGPCQQKVCTTDHRCMTLITAEMVLAAAARFLGPATADG